MKTIQVKDINNFEGTIIVPVFETTAHNVIPITFDDVEVSSRVFYGKKDSSYLVESKATTYLFVGLGKEIDYKSLKTIFRRVAANSKDIFGKSVVLALPKEFTSEQLEASISGLVLGTYNLGHYKKQFTHPFLGPEFELQILSENNYKEVTERAI
ncbi:M17 family peptidase N-terminal domain-containing protein [Flavobacterium sp. 14A]|uniref:M17 family peptidase N-terminal domain-containing protein n=1 Tax=Flavobacterium sp. 14A TaxID=2735896 RepID=UPI0020C701BB|nr:M17 family peptidase N-terminal domain-containing protein [Flavobacterium sp. 14A]NRT10691.1 hypothetical protein [Flavobacterium sp. 14A]